MDKRKWRGAIEAVDLRQFAEEHASHQSKNRIHDRAVDVLLHSSPSSIPFAIFAGESYVRLVF